MNFERMLGQRSLMVMVNNEPYHVARPEHGGDRNQYERVIAALNNPDTTAEQMLAILNPTTSVATATVNQPKIQIRDNRLFYDGREVHNALATRIIDVIEQGLDVDAWVKFAENVYANPEEFSRDELYLFLEKNDLPITTDGHFLAYKNVRDDYTDIYTGTVDYHPGNIVSMDRNAVDKNRDRTCSSGLHFAGKSYLPHYGAGSNGTRTLIVKINPADVVSIPRDYDNAKGRTWRMEVIAEIPFVGSQNRVWPAVVDDDPGEWDEEAWDSYAEPDDDGDGMDDDDIPAPSVHTNTVNAMTERPRKGFRNWLRGKGN